MAQSNKTFHCHGRVLELDPAEGADYERPSATRSRSNGAAAPRGGDRDGGDGRDDDSRDGSYFLPTDSAEQDRLDEQHKLCLMLLDGKLGLAPVKAPRRVLDVATGTGIWAIQYAEQQPQAEVVGADLCVFQHESPAANCSFVRLDVEKDAWGLDHGFDYIHFRYVLSCFDDTRAVIGTAFDHLSPGGYVEFHDFVFSIVDLDGSFKGTALERWQAAVSRGAASVGRDLNKAVLYPGWCRDAGFVDVTETLFPLPFGTWVRGAAMKRLGEAAVRNIRALIGGSLRSFLELAGLSKSEMEELIDEAMEDTRDPNIHYAGTV
ncbi:hypothetical protein CDD83_6432 [Cordyceps sp. RAO-2017]|nr:hypothetical protein CDD83_6432 [Cordyceps sp. RAO-2017]